MKNSQISNFKFEKNIWENNSFVKDFVNLRLKVRQN